MAGSLGRVRKSRHSSGLSGSTTFRLSLPDDGNPTIDRVGIGIVANEGSTKDGEAAHLIGIEGIVGQPPWAGLFVSRLPPITDVH